MYVEGLSSLSIMIETDKPVKHMRRDYELRPLMLIIAKGQVSMGDYSNCPFRFVCLSSDGRELAYYMLKLFKLRL